MASTGSGGTLAGLLFSALSVVYIVLLRKWDKELVRRQAGSFREP
jgi:membrane protein implicated in regulation of membrane protease activity